MDTPCVERLDRFLRDLGNLSGDQRAHDRKPGIPPTELGRFLEAIRSATEQSALTKAEPAAVGISALRVATFLNGLREPLQRLHAVGGFCNPWHAARLGRDEVRNTAVLAWLLDPEGDHGLGPVLLTALLDRVHCTHSQIPSAPAGRVRVARESWLDSENGSRVDIEVRSRTPHAPFYLLIEAKIDAVEGPGQLASYAEAAARTVGDDRWAVVFLTKDGRRSQSALSSHAANILRLSWGELSRVLLSALRRIEPSDLLFQSFSIRLAETFLRHIRAF